MDWRLSIRLEFFNKFFSVDQLEEYKPHENFVSICPCGKKKEKRKKDEVQQRNPKTKKMKKQSTPVLANKEKERSYWLCFYGAGIGVNDI